MNFVDKQIISKKYKYQIVVQGVLPINWKDWFDGFIIIEQSSTTTKMFGSFIDQASFHGVLTKFRDWGLIILSIKMLDDLRELHENNT